MYKEKFDLSHTLNSLKISLCFSCPIQPQLFQIQLSAYTMQNFHSWILSSHHQSDFGTPSLNQLNLLSLCPCSNWNWIKSDHSIALFSFLSIIKLEIIALRLKGLLARTVLTELSASSFLFFSLRHPFEFSLHLSIHPSVSMHSISKSMSSIPFLF